MAKARQVASHVERDVRNKYGFVPDTSVSPFRNAARLFDTLPPNDINPLHLINLPSNLAFHDLTPGKVAPSNARLLLGMSPKFIKTPKFTTGCILSNLYRLERDFHLKVYFAGSDLDRDKISKLYVNSKWRPEWHQIPGWVDYRLSKFFNRLKERFKRRRAASNLLPIQDRTLDELLEQSDLLFPLADKNLGWCAVHYDDYVKDGLIHLTNDEIYRQLSEQEAWTKVESIREEIDEWLDEFEDDITDHEAKYIRAHMGANSLSPFGQFYIMYKIHKGMKNNRWPTRPVCSDVTSIPHGLGKWTTEKLLPVAEKQPSYFKDSFALKEQLDQVVVPNNALVWTADASAMYTYIKTEPALIEFNSYLRAEEGSTFSHYSSDSLMAALKIVFRNNIFKFGDTYWQQVSGTGMGVSPAPPWATIFFALYERTLVPRWAKYISFYRRFIDDIFGIWICDPDPEENLRQWTAFKAELQLWHGLTWTCTEPSTSCVFMDMEISIEGSRLVTRVYEKDLNLYLYLPPNSAHSKGVGTGLVFGQVLRYRRLSTYQTDADEKIREFHQRLRARGHSNDKLIPLFQRAEENAANYMARTEADHQQRRASRKEEAESCIRLHLTYHPDELPAKDIQELWRNNVARPPGETPLPKCVNHLEEEVGFEKLVVAYHRPTNLGNLFSIRDIHGRGKQVSQYLAE